MKALQYERMIRGVAKVPLKRGDNVAFDMEVDERGFHHRIVGTISWIDTRDPLVLVEIRSVYAYHPANPESGRRLPGDKRICVNIDEIELLKVPYPLCSMPEKCAGKGYCRKDPACNE